MPSRVPARLVRGNYTMQLDQIDRKLDEQKGLLISLERQGREHRRATIDRPGGLNVRAAACTVLAHTEGRIAEDVAREHFATDRDLDRLLTLRAVTNPASTTVATWAAELTQTVTGDVADRLIPESLLIRLRGLGIEYSLSGSPIRIPTWSPTATGGFVGESAPIPVAAFTFGAITLGPKKAATIIAATDELLAGSPVDVELTLRAILSESIGLMIDGILLDSTAASAIRPAGLLNGATTVTATSGGGLAALNGDIKLLTAAIAPALKPVLITGPIQAASLGLLAPNAALDVLVAPTLAAGTVIAVDVSAFASAVGVPTFRASQNAAWHEDSTPLPLGTTGSPNVVAAPMRSGFQTDVTALRTIIPLDWTLRRTGAVAVLTGSTW